MKRITSVITALLIALSLSASPASADGTYEINTGNTVVANGPWGSNSRYWNPNAASLAGEQRGTINGNKVFMLPAGRNKMQLSAHHFLHSEQVCYEVYMPYASPYQYFVRVCSNIYLPDGAWYQSFCVPGGAYAPVMTTWGFPGGTGNASVPHTVDIASRYDPNCGAVAP